MGKGLAVLSPRNRALPCRKRRVFVFYHFTDVLPGAKLSLAFPPRGGAFGTAASLEETGKPIEQPSALPHRRSPQRSGKGGYTAAVSAWSPPGLTELLHPVIPKKSFSPCRHLTGSLGAKPLN